LAAALKTRIQADFSGASVANLMITGFAMAAAGNAIVAIIRYRNSRLARTGINNSLLI
jgi:hypothetical protein